MVIKLGGQVAYTNHLCGPELSRYLFAYDVKWYGMCPGEVTTELNLLDVVYESGLSLPINNFTFTKIHCSSQLLQQYDLDISNWYKVTFLFFF